MLRFTQGMTRAFSCAMVVGGAKDMDYDLLIRGGTIVDGSGVPAFRGDVAVAGGKIAAVGRVDGSAKQTLEADGRAVTPGFVDVHTHYDAQVFWDRMLTISPWHGVTTVVMGNCGFGIAPTRASQRSLIVRSLEKVEGMSREALEAGLGEDWGFETFPEFLGAIERRGTAINTAAMVGHTPIRFYVMGEAATERAATADEIDRMAGLVAQAMEAGAVGFATSRAPTHVVYEGRQAPSRAAELGEIEALVRSLRPLGRGVVQAAFGPGFFLEQFASLARASGRPITWTALLTGLRGPGWHREVLERSRSLQAEGLAVYPQVTPRPLNFEFDWKEPFLFEGMPEFRAVSAADAEEKKRLYADPEFRRTIRERIGGKGSARFAERWARTHISYAPNAPELEERLVSEVAQERGVDPLDLVLDLGLASNLEARFRMAVLNTDESEVAECLVDSSTMLGLSDAGAHASQLCDACYSTDLLAKWVRTKGLLSLEAAIQLLCSRPADIFGFTDRGRIAQGLAADLVVFDPATVGASQLRRVHDLPAGADRLVADATGVDAVVVNGTVLRSGGRDAVDPEGPLPGRVLRSGGKHAR
jgi:N-acyl-D-amino-acid deacylase